MAEKQTQTDDGVKGRSEDKSQESDLAALVRQYEEETGDRSENNLQVLKSLQPVVDFAKGEMSRREQSLFDEAIDGAYKFVTEDESLKGLKKPLVRGFLEAYGIENPKFGEAFQNQRKDPDTWQSMLGKGREWVKEQYEDMVKGVSKSNLRSDLEAAKAAVAGTSTDEADGEKVDVTELFTKSDSDFKKYIDGEIAKASQ